MIIIEEFLKRYTREYDFYHNVASLAAQHLERELKEESIRAIVSHRAKSPAKLEQKIKQRCEKRRNNGEKDFLAIEEIYNDIADLAGVRIALYFPDDQKRVEDIIVRLFKVEGKPKKNFPLKPLTVQYVKRFSGYQAIHYRVYLTDDLLGIDEKQYVAARIEIQVASVLMHAWAEVEHDLIYKPLSGILSEDEHAILDEINGLVLAGEIALGRLQQAMERRASQGRFNNQFELSSYLYEYKQKHLPNTVLGNVEQLFSFLCEAGLNHSEQLSKFLLNLDSDKPIADWILDQMLSDKQTHMAVKDQSLLQKWQEARRQVQVTMSPNTLLSRARVKRGLNPRDIAIQLNVSLSTYMRLERGFTKPNAALVMALSKYFAMTPEDLGFQFAPEKIEPGSRNSDSI